MEKNHKNTDLRDRAEQELENHEKEGLKDLSSAEADEIIQELRVRQVELEMQNEELRKTNAEFEASCSKYIDLYDHSPVGYLTFDKQGAILEANLTASKMLGIESESLVNYFFSHFIKSEYRERFFTLRKKVFETFKRQSCELELIKKDGSNFFARLDSIYAVDPEGRNVCRTTLKDITERKVAEAALNDSETKFRSIFDRAAESIVLVAPETGKMVDFNDKAHESLGYTREEFCNLSIPDIEEIESKEDVEKHMELILKNGSDVFETLHRTKSGEIRNILVKAQIIPIDGKQFFLSMFEDITEQKRMEMELKEKEERFRRAFQEGPLGISTVGMDYRFKMVNDRMSEITGYSQEELLSRTFADITYPGDVNTDIELAERLFRGEIPNYNIDKRYIRKDGKIIWVNLTASIVRNEKGEPLYGLGIISDITKRKHIEEDLIRSEQNLLEAERIAHLGSWGYDISSRMLNWSEETYRIYDIDPSTELNYETLRERVHPDDLEYYDRQMEEWIKNKDGDPFDFRIVRTDGTVRHLHLIGNIICNKSERAVRMFGTVQDITDRKIIEDELRESRERLRSLSSHLQFMIEEEKKLLSREIHDVLGQALTALKIDLSLLNKKLQGTDRVLQKEMAMILAKTDSVIDTVKSIATWLRTSLLDDLGLISAIEWQVQNFSKRTGIKCQLTTDINDLLIDRNHSTSLYRIVQEALTNISLHSDAESVKVNVDKINNLLYITVSDDGKGITEKQISDSGSIGIIGMQERAEISGGNLSISGQEGKGTTIKVSIPLNNKEDI